MKESSGKICIGLISLAVILTIPLVFFPFGAFATDYAFTTIDVPGAEWTYPYGINNSGHIVGTYNDAQTGKYHGFLYAGGNFTRIDVPSTDATVAYGINNYGNVVGYGSFVVSQSSLIHGFVDIGGNFTNIDFTSPIPGLGAYAIPHGINDSGNIVGYYYSGGTGTQGFLYAGGNFTTIGSLGSSGFYNVALGINNLGDIVGYYDSQGFSHGFLYAGGKFTTIDFPYVPKDPAIVVLWVDTTLQGLNDSGEIVGSATVVTCIAGNCNDWDTWTEEYYPFLYAGGNFTPFEVPGALSTFIFGINDSGSVVGQYNDQTGREHGFVATPVPIPVVLCRNVTVIAGSNCTANASINNGSYEPNGDPVTLTQIPAGPYQLGTTPVTLTVTDSKNSSSQSQCTGTVSVRDKTPPAITMTSVNPAVLWPPNHKMVDVTVNYTATDNCNQPACKISGVTSNEPISSSDYSIMDAHHVKLSADRSGSGRGRMYTISIMCTDPSGNSSAQTMAVSVPRDQGKH